jgi:uncharacterized protein (DUF488 family)
MGGGAGLKGVGLVQTLGHSTRSLDELVGLLEEFEIGILVDVRRFPGSRRYPHFSRDALADRVAGAGIEYRHEPDLGGRREARPDSLNTAWRAAAFRGYADHMATEEFAAALQRVIEWQARRPALMCAEAVPWRCHRQLIADALVARGLEVLHVIGPGKVMPHALHPQARVSAEGSLTYDLPAVDRPTLFTQTEE